MLSPGLPLPAESSDVVSTLSTVRSLHAIRSTMRSDRAHGRAFGSTTAADAVSSDAVSATDAISGAVSKRRSVADANATIHSTSTAHATDG